MRLNLRWEDDETEFSVHLKDLAVGGYTLNVAGEEQEAFDVMEEDEGEMKLKFTDPQKENTLLAGFRSAWTGD